MKFLKRLSAVTLCLLLCGCGGKEMTLHLSFGDRTGTYTGDTNSDGLPDGEGKFTTKNEDGNEWTYTGSFKNGHFEGEGVTEWKNIGREVGTYKNDEIIPMTGEELQPLFSDPDNLKDHVVEFSGQVFSEDSAGDGAKAFQVWTDYRNVAAQDDDVLVVISSDLAKDIKTNDYIHVIGTVTGSSEGTNAFGGVLSIPTVAASTVEILTYEEAVHPAISEKEVNSTEEQNDVKVTLQSVSFSEDQTRIRLKAQNQSSSSVSLNVYDAKVIQDGRQYEQEPDYNADYAQLSYEILPGASTEGVLVFPAIKDSSFVLHLDATSSNYEIDMKAFEFEVK